MIKNLKNALLDYLMHSDNEGTFGGVERWRVTALVV